MKTYRFSAFAAAMIALAACNSQTAALSGDDRPEAPGTGPVAPGTNAILSLLPLPSDPDTRPQDYCVIEGPPRKLIVKIKNSGSLDYPGSNQSVVAVTWISPPLAKQTRPIPEVPGGRTRELSPRFDAPAACFEAEQRCRFTIELANQRPVEGTCTVIL